MAWVDGLAQWQDHERKLASISVAFSWKLREAARLARYWADRGYLVSAGGPAVMIPQNAKILAPYVDAAAKADALPHHNPDATMASRGCPVGCWFCVVPKYEGTSFTLIPDFTPRPILCDNNLSALPEDYQDHIINRYRETGIPLLDANSGFEPHTFDPWTYHRWSRVLVGPWRFALDEMRELPEVESMMRVIRRLRSLKGQRQRKMIIYVLIGNEPIASCYERVHKVIEWGGEPYCQPLLPLNALDRHAYRILHDWDPVKLGDFARWSNRWLWRRIPLREYIGRVGERSSFAGMAL